MIDKGFMITSIDEEGGLDIPGYEDFSKGRYSEKTISQSSAVFVGTRRCRNFKKSLF